MTKRFTFIFWSCVITIQLTGATMDFLGGNLDDPIRLIGILLLTPGLDLIWGWMGRHLTTNTTPAEYASMLGIAVAINFAIAGLIHFFFWIIWQIRQSKVNSN